MRSASPDRLVAGMLLGVVVVGCSSADRPGPQQAAAPAAAAEPRAEAKNMEGSAIAINQLSGTDFQSQISSLVAKIDRGELSAVQGFDLLVATAASFKPATSSGLETPAYAETRTKSQVLEGAFRALVGRALRSLPTEPAARKAALDHLYGALKPFSVRSAPGEARWSGAGLNELLYDIAKQQEAAGAAGR